MPRIFISYRRVDSADFVGHLVDCLIPHVGADSIVMAGDEIPLGVDFQQVVASEVAQCAALIAVIGDRWLTVTNDAGLHRLDDPGDYVRLAIVAALARDILVIPALAQGVCMPGEDDLPAPLKPLACRNPVVLSHERLDADVARLIRQLKYIVAFPAPPLVAPVADAAHAPLLDTLQRPLPVPEISPTHSSATADFSTTPRQLERPYVVLGVAVAAIVVVVAVMLVLSGVVGGSSDDPGAASGVQAAAMATSTSTATETTCLTDTPPPVAIDTLRPTVTRMTVACVLVLQYPEKRYEICLDTVCGAWRDDEYLSSSTIVEFCDILESIGTCYTDAFALFLYDGDWNDIQDWCDEQGGVWSRGSKR